MRDFYFIVLVTTFVFNLNHANGDGDDDEDRKYEKLRQDAANCEVGASIKVGCNWCKCEAKGVMMCTKKKCSPYEPDTDQSIQERKDDEQKDDDGSNEDEDTDYEMQTFQKLRGEAAECEVGKTVKKWCYICKCLITGVLKCKRLLGCGGAGIP